MWEPGERLVVTYRNAHRPPGDTEIDVRFEALLNGTRATLSSPRRPQDVGGSAGERLVNFMAWFDDYADDRLP